MAKIDKEEIIKAFLVASKSIIIFSINFFVSQNKQNLSVETWDSSRMMGQNSKLMFVWRWLEGIAYLLFLSHKVCSV